ncbi:MiaB/RimO family radical SAM methylthiotransferase [Olsenella sp. DNF00959]|uniref:MiaB/RimO family radical SAM methylthiotransferase n=1 Tax=Olsenella sp. DNF00959 TaxID=1476999 RepID=UPI000785E9A6|nr:MiaB/RimO family radical SAM methylthiotransferase [Olsenella sp. DNF00959]KXB62515.1 radical SAM methylthiotransferase, MiaB/RimO family [Olsenella sp. DNF00959]
MTRHKVALINLGCRVNRVENDLVASQLEGAGLELCDPAAAELVVVNTCAVTGEAEAKTRKRLRRVAQLPQAPLVLASGCVANLRGEELEGLAPNIEVVRDKSRLAEVALSRLGLEPGSVTDAGELAATPTPTGRMRPGIKIQDGCDNRCSYCIVWKARGASRSTGVGEVLRQVRSAVARGGHEVVLTGINLGRFRGEAEDGRGITLSGLIDLILGETEVERVRLSSIEPPDVTDELLDAMARGGERVAPFLHVCLQSGCDDTLRRMRRVYGTAEYRRTVLHARERIEGLALGTDLIVGFPGETGEEFEASLAFCEEMAFAKMHVFRYSARPGTPAATAEGQVPPRVMAERGRRMRELAARMRRQSASARVGSEELAVVQYPGRAVTGRLHDLLVDPSAPLDALVRARVTSVMDDGTLVGTLL